VSLYLNILFSPGRYQKIIKKKGEEMKIWSEVVMKCFKVLCWYSLGKHGK